MMDAPVVEPKIEPDSYTSASTGHNDPEVAAVHKTGWLRRNSRVLLLVLAAFILVAAITGGAVGAVLHNRHQPVTSPTSSEPNGTLSKPNGTLSEPNGTLSEPNGTLLTNNNSLPMPNPRRASSCRGGICPFTIATIAWSDTQFVFGLSSNRSLVYKAGSGNQWNATWSDLGGNFTYAPVVVSPSPGNLAAIGIQEDQALYWKAYRNGTWELTWTRLGGTWGTALSAVSRSSSFINVYGVESEGGHLQQSGWALDADGSAKWLGFVNLGGACFSSPSAVAWNGSREDIFVRGSDNALWHLYWNWNTSWSKWESLGGIITSPPLTVSAEEGWLDIFVLGMGNSFCWRGFRQVWMSWDCISENLTFESIPSATVIGSKRVDAVGLASDDHTYHKSLTDTSWSTNWDDLGGPLNGAPVAASFAPNKGSVLGIGMDNDLYIGSWDSLTFNWEGSSTWSSLGGDFITLP